MSVMSNQNVIGWLTDVAGVLMWVPLGLAIAALVMGVITNWGREEQ